MRSGKVIAVDWLGEMPNQDAGAEPVWRVQTDLPYGEVNSFYMDVVEDKPQGGSVIWFDIPHAVFSKCVRYGEYGEHRVPQRGNSFDIGDQNHAAV